MYWFSYGGGVNSTALAILMVRGKLPQYEPWRIIFSDTGEEKPGTYRYIDAVFKPWLSSHGRTLEIVKPLETVLERWERLSVTGSRLLRSCTDYGKIKPLRSYREENGGGEQIIGIDADEPHRMADREGIHRPLVDLDIGRDECVAIIVREGLPVPPKSGCWCCPFARVGEVIRLAQQQPEKFDRIANLEVMATLVHGCDEEGRPRTQWHNKTAIYWRDRAANTTLEMFDEEDSLPCGCGT